MMHEVVGVTSTGNGGDGFFAAVMHTLLVDVHTVRNLRDGTQAMGMGVAIGSSTAEDNQGYGIFVTGMDLDDRGGNGGTGNAGLVGVAGTPTARLAETLPSLVQCRVGMMTGCR